MSNQYRFISLKVIIDRVMRDPVMNDLDIDSAILEAIDCINLIANPTFLDSKDVYLDVADYRTELPFNLVNVTKTVKVSNNGDTRTSMHSISDPYYKTYNGRTDNLLNNYEQYKIQGDYLYTNFEEGTLHMVYDALPLDTEGFIMIPDNTTVIKAVEFYLKAYHYNIKWVSDKLSESKFRWAEGEKNFYVGKAQSAKLMEGLDSIQGLSNILTKFLPDENAHLNDYAYSTNKEYRRTHR